MTTANKPPEKCCGSSVVFEISHCGKRHVCLVCGKAWYPFEIRPPTPAEIAETNIGWLDMEKEHDPDSARYKEYIRSRSLGGSKRGPLYALGRC